MKAIFIQRIQVQPANQDEPPTHRTLLELTLDLPFPPNRDISFLGDPFLIAFKPDVIEIIQHKGEWVLFLYQYRTAEYRTKTMLEASLPAFATRGWTQSNHSRFLTRTPAG